MVGVADSESQARHRRCASGIVHVLPSLDDPRLALYPMEKRKEIIRMLKTQKRDPDMMIKEPMAITTRVAPSFMRIGHVDLFARRAQQAAMENRFDDLEYEQLEQIIWHSAFREFYKEAYLPFKEANDIKGCLKAILHHSAVNLAKMVSGWIRVGFCQGNFNADNCLIAGRTMDYGPFGFMDEYNPLFAKWTGSNEHFAFINQPSAAYANYIVLVESMLQVLRRDDDAVNRDVDHLQQTLSEDAKKIFRDELDAVWSAKLGFDSHAPVVNVLWGTLEPLLRESRADWTMFWRQLTYVARDFDLESIEYEKMIANLVGNHHSLSSPFYQHLTPEINQRFTSWMREWREALRAAPSSNTLPEETMRLANPKYTLREWMLVDAYNDAAVGLEDKIILLNELIQKPYDEGKKEWQQMYYRQAVEEDLVKGGTAFMS